MEDILKLKNNLIRSIRNREDALRIIEKYKLFIDGVLNRDIPHVNKLLRDRISLCYLEFLKQMLKKGYINRENIYDYMEKLIEATSYFGETNEEFANFQSNIIRFNFNSSYAKNNMKHLLCHELVHASIFGRKFDCGKYKEITPNNKKMTITSSNLFVPIINADMHSHFIEEIIAEATVCDLLDDYSNKSSVFPGIDNIKSDWITPYNRQYQQLGYTFFKTVYPYSEIKNERELFKALTLKSLNSNADVGKEILTSYMKKNPNNWKDDLHEITTILGTLAKEHTITLAKVNRVRELMEKYNKKSFVVIKKDGIPINNSHSR